MVVDPFPEITIVLLNDPGSPTANRPPTTGHELDNVVLEDPFVTTPVLEDLRIGDDQLTISVIGLTGAGTFNLNGGTSGTLGFGINSNGSMFGFDNSFDFDAAPFNESVTFAFNQDLFITAIDLNGSLLTGGSLNESFEVGGVEIGGNIDPNDIFDFTADPDRPEGLFVAAGDGVLFRPIVGSGNIASLTVQIAPPAVPEPSTAVLLVSLGMIGVARRRRK